MNGPITPSDVNFSNGKGRFPFETRNELEGPSITDFTLEALRLFVDFAERNKNARITFPLTAPFLKDTLYTSEYNVAALATDLLPSVLIHIDRYEFVEQHPHVEWDTRSERFTDDRDEVHFQLWRETR